MPAQEAANSATVNQAANRPDKDDEGALVTPRRGRKPRAPDQLNLLKEHEMRRGRHHGSASPAEADDEAEDRQFVVALARGLEVLNAFRPKDGPLGNRDLAERTGVPTATISRITHTLTKLGYLNFDARRETYDLGGSTLALGYVAQARLNIRNIARPLMKELAAEVNMSIGLGIADRTMMMYIETAEGSGLLGLRLFPGLRIPMATSSMGRAYLAGLPVVERAALMEELRPQFGTEWSTVSRGIDRAIEQIARDGFCTAIGEWQQDIFGVAVPLVLPDDQGVYTLNLGGPVSMVDKKVLHDDLGPRMLAIATKILAVMQPGGTSRQL